MTTWTPFSEGKRFHKAHDAGQGIGRFEIYQQDEAVFAVFPHAAFVGTEQFHDGLDVHIAEGAVGRQVLAVVGDQNLAVLQEDIGLDGGAML